MSITDGKEPPRDILYYAQTLVGGTERALETDLEATPAIFHTEEEGAKKRVSLCHIPKSVVATSLLCN